MPDPAAHSLPETLLKHAGFVRALARATLRGDPECEDVEQDAWVEALRGIPAEPTRQRGWLAAVVRHRAFDLLRRRRRRAERERVAARVESVPAADEAVARAEAVRRVVDAVLALDPAYRSVILLRFLDGLPPREVAARLGLPVETVRTRVRRGLERLRISLREETGDARERSRAFLLLAGGAGAGGFAQAAVAIGGALVAKKVAVVAALLLLLAGGTWIAVDLTSPEGGQTDHRPAPARAAGTPAPTTSPTLAARPRTDAPASPPPSPATSPETVVTGIVVDETGAPVKGAVVFTAGWRGGTVIEKEEEIESVRAEPTDEEGRFRLRLAGLRAGTIGVRARAPGFVVASPGNLGYPLQIDVRQEARITLHRGVALHIRVTDAADGRPIAGARVAAYAGAGYLLHTWPPVDADVTSAEGAADLVAPGGDVRVVAEAAGRAQGEVLVRAAPPSAEAVVALGTGGTVKGTIIDPAGRPVAGAHLVMLRAPCARAEATTDAGGRFRFEHVPPAGKEPEPIVAKRVVVLACDAEGYGRQFLSCEPPSEGGEIEVRFALAELATLEVHVRDARGSPVAGLRVSYGPEEGRVAWGWTTLRVARAATTDVNGVFTAAELPPGRVALRIPFDAEEPRYVEVPASGPVEIVLAASAVARRVRVRTAAGAPVVKATVRAWSPIEPGAGWRDRREGGTDADGLTTVSVPEVGPVTLVVVAPGGAIVAVPLVEGLRPDPIDIGLGEGRVQGRVLSLDGAPLRVRLAPTLWLEAGGGVEEIAGWQGAVEADVEGRFAFDRLAGDPVGVSVVGSGLSILEHERISPGTAPVTLHALTPAQVTALTASAEVVDAVTGAALRDSAKVTAVATAGGERATLLWSQNTGEHRAYAPLPPGEWTIRAEAEGYEPAEVRVTLAGSGSSPRPRIVLRRR